MGRGGGGGGGRSSSGGSVGGSRSSSGHRGGGSSGRGGFSGGFSGSFGNSGGYRPVSHNYYHDNYRHSGYSNRTVINHYHNGSGSSSSDNKVVNVIVYAIIIIAMLFGLFTALRDNGWISSGGDITTSTVAREPLDKSLVTTTEYFDDNMNWIGSSSKLEKGMKHFYKKTGIQPYLYLTETIDGESNPTNAEMETFANKLYEDLFDDEGHLLLVFQEYNSSGNYLCWQVCGKQAKTVMDQEAMDILYDYVDHYYYGSLDEDQMFSKIFEDTADRIMDKTTNPLIVIALVGGGIVILLIGFSWWKKIKKQKNLEAEQTERILNTPMEDIKSPEDQALEDLENKYK